MFFWYSLVGMWIFRRLGWGLSRSILYRSSWAVAIILLVTSGGGIAYGFRHLLLWLHPGSILKIFGYGAASYVSIPNYGLFKQNSIPADVEPRHLAVSNISLVVFVILSIVFAFLINK
jgi:hypothetical protein